PFCGSSLTQQSVFVKEHEHNPAKIEFFKREAQPVKIAWQSNAINRTEIGRITMADPELGELIPRAVAVQEEWLNAIRVAAEREAAEAKQRLQDADAKLGRAPMPADQTRLRLAKEAAAR